MLTYAAVEDQPVQGRTRDQLADDERPVYDKFRDAAFVEGLVKYLTLEENKGKDKFHAKHFTLFKVCLTDSASGDSSLRCDRIPGVT